MRRRHTQNLPCIWLMTDERMGDDLWAALRALPKGGGIVFRHYSLSQMERRALFAKVVRLARPRRQRIVVAGQALSRADGRHGQRCGTGLSTAPVHSVQERIAAERAGADLLFVSPVFSTRSHKGAKSLGRVRFGLMIRGAKAPIIALGGMDARRARSLKAFGLYGWAAIDAFLPNQKRTEVPT